MAEVIDRALILEIPWHKSLDMPEMYGNYVTPKVFFSKDASS